MKITNDVSYVQINFASNGGYVEYSGRDADGDYQNAREVFTDINQALSLVEELYATANEYK